MVKVRPDGTFAVRNRIYERAFDRRWLRRARPADWAYRSAVVLGVLLLLSTGMWYEFLYPRTYAALLGTDVGESVARDAYHRLQRVPFSSREADRLWGEYLLQRRMRFALEHDDRFRGGTNADDLARSARSELQGLETPAGLRQAGR